MRPRLTCRILARRRLATFSGTMRNHPPDPALYMLTPERVADHLDLPVSLVYRFIASGALEAREVEPGVLRVPRSAFERFLAEHPWLRAIVRNSAGK